MLGRPRVDKTTPSRNATGVKLDAFVSAELDLPNAGIDVRTMHSGTVYISRTSDGAREAARVKTSGGGDVLVVVPREPLDPNTTYTFHVTSGLKDTAGASFESYSVNFKTGTASNSGSTGGFSFTRYELETTKDTKYLSLVIGPDKRLYAGTDDGRILRFNINESGSLGSPEELTAFNDLHGRRYISGLTFEPGSTADNPILWVAHSAGVAVGAPDWAGKISRITGGTALNEVKDVITNLPRSLRDHLNGQLVFGPDGMLFFSQGSMTAMGAPDAAWGRRGERLLSSAILRVNAAAVKNLAAPLDVKTREGGGTYDPYAAGAPLTIYATGVRNAYDLVWHSNGKLYAPTNGSAAGGSTPGGPGVPALDGVEDAETDFLFQINKDGYYGHPNPLRGEYVLNGGNPTDDEDPFEVHGYPVGTEPDTSWQQAVWDFGLHESPNGVIEYKSEAFGGQMKGKMLVARYSGGSDVTVLDVNADGSIAGQYGKIPGLDDLFEPLDVVEDTVTGNLYVSEYGGKRITLLKPAVAATPPDLVAPTASFTVPPAPVTLVGTAPQTFKITFADDKLINHQTINPEDVLITRRGDPAGTAPLKVTELIKPVGTSEGFYEVAFTTEVPGGAWGYEDNGTYDVTLINRAFADAAGNRNVAVTASFDVTIERPIVVEPPPSPTPQPPPGQPDSIVRGKAQLRLIAAIGNYAARNGLAVPDVSAVPNAGLKAVLTGLKQQVKRDALAAKVQFFADRYQLPAGDLTALSLQELKVRFAELKAEAKRQGYIGKLTAAAAQKAYALPDLTSLSMFELKSLAAAVKQM